MTTFQYISYVDQFNYSLGFFDFGRCLRGLCEDVPGGHNLQHSPPGTVRVSIPVFRLE